MPKPPASPTGNRRDRIRLTEAEVVDFLAANSKVQVATVDRHGAPHLSTLFYTMLDGRLAFWTYAASQKIVNLRRNPTLTCLVEDGVTYRELRGVVLYGRAEIVEDRDTVLRVGLAVAARMENVPLESLNTPEVQAEIARSGRKRVAVFMSTDRVVSWDHRKI